MVKKPSLLRDVVGVIVALPVIIVGGVVFMLIVFTLTSKD
jgi:hypothetical protein